MALQGVHRATPDIAKQIQEKRKERNSKEKSSKMKTNGVSSSPILAFFFSFFFFFSSPYIKIEIPRPWLDSPVKFHDHARNQKRKPQSHKVSNRRLRTHQNTQSLLELATKKKVNSRGRREK